MAEKQVGMVAEYDPTHEAMSFRDGITMILKEPFKTAGTLLKWSVNFVKKNEICLQIWRPVAGKDNEFVNVYDQKVDCDCAEVGLGDVEIPAKEPFQVEVDDRIGVAVQEGTLGIGYARIPPENYLTREYKDMAGGDNEPLSFKTREYYRVKLFVTASYREN